MTLFVDQPVTGGKRAKPRYRKAFDGERHVRVRVVDADSPTFGADFESAFRANVRRIRADNRRIAQAAE